MLGAAHLTGSGVPKDIVEALHWLLRSQRLAYEPAAGFVRTARAIASSEQLREAKRRADAPLSSADAAGGAP